jgi:hypothetical protein
MRAQLVALALTASLVGASALPTPFASTSNRAPRRHLARALLQEDPMDYNAGSTFDSIKDVVDSVESSFDSVYETVKSWEPASAPTPGDDELADDTDEEGQVELLAPAEAPGPERRRALLQDDAYYSDYLAAAPDAAVEDYDYGEIAGGPVGAPAPAPGPYNR